MMTVESPKPLRASSVVRTPPTNRANKDMTATRSERILPQMKRIIVIAKIRNVYVVGFIRREVRVSHKDAEI